MTSRDILLVIDVGTTGTKTLAFRSDGCLQASAYREYQNLQPSPERVEVDARVWLDAARDTCREVMGSDDIRDCRLAAISITNQRETVVAVDENGSPLSNALIWQDRRTADICTRMAHKMDPAEVFELTGLTINPYFSASKMRWLLDNLPKTGQPGGEGREIHKLLLVADLLVHRLTGRFVTDPSNASRTLLFDLERGRWSSELLRSWDIDRDLLPDIEQSGTVVGEVDRDMGREMMIPEGTPVVLGGGDQQCAALGLGVIRPGMAKATTGTGTFLLGYSSKPVRDSQMRLLTSAHAVAGAYVMEGSIFATGALYRWFRDHLGGPELSRARSSGEDPYELLNGLWTESPPGCHGLTAIPHFLGAGAPRWDTGARGGLVGLTTAHGRSHILRAMLESVCFELRRCLEVFEDTGNPVENLRLSGGLNRSDDFVQMQSDICNIPVERTSTQEATALGGAMAASVGVGLHPDVATASREMVHVSDRHVPRKGLLEAYLKAYERYLTVEDRVNSC